MRVYINVETLTENFAPMQLKHIEMTTCRSYVVPWYHVAGLRQILNVQSGSICQSDGRTVCYSPASARAYYKVIIAACRSLSLVYLNFSALCSTNRNFPIGDWKQNLRGVARSPTFFIFPFSEDGLLQRISVIYI